MLTVAQQTSLLQIYVAGNNENFSGLHVKYRIRFFPDFSQIRIFSTEIHKSPQYQISRKSVYWEPLTRRHTDGRTYMTKLVALFATMRTRLQMDFSRNK